MTSHLRQVRWGLRGYLILNDSGSEALLPSGANCLNNCQICTCQSKKIMGKGGTCVMCIVQMPSMPLPKGRESRCKLSHPWPFISCPCAKWHQILGSIWVVQWCCFILSRPLIAFSGQQQSRYNHPLLDFRGALVYDAPQSALMRVATFAEDLGFFDNCFNPCFFFPWPLSFAQYTIPLLSHCVPFGWGPCAALAGISAFATWANGWHVRDAQRI